MVVEPKVYLIRLFKYDRQIWSNRISRLRLDRDAIPTTIPIFSGLPNSADFISTSDNIDCCRKKQDSQLTVSSLPQDLDTMSAAILCIFVTRSRRTIMSKNKCKLSWISVYSLLSYDGCTCVCSRVFGALTGIWKTILAYGQLTRSALIIWPSEGQHLMQKLFLGKLIKFHLSTLIISQVVE